MNALVTDYFPQGFELIAFPTNQFGLQEPGTNTEILNCMRYVRPGNNYVPNFPLTEKQQVNGANQHPLFTFLKNHCPGTILEIGETIDMYWDPVRQTDITWNFEKFLVGRDGKPVYRYHPSVTPNDIRPHIETLLAVSPKAMQPVEGDVKAVLSKMAEIVQRRH